MLRLAMIWGMASTIKASERGRVLGKEAVQPGQKPFAGCINCAEQAFQIAANGRII